MATDEVLPTVLIVDDDIDMQALLGLYARQAGYDVVGEAGDGEQAIELWQAHRESGTPVDVIVLDQMMPVLTGLEVATAIRASDTDVVLVLISAAMTPALAEAARRVGVEHVLSKSDLRVLTATLSR